MKARKTETLVHLSELPPEGRSYSYSRQSGELDAVLEDLIAANNYDFEMFIKPMGGAFEVSGRMRTTLDLQCSRCALDFKLPIQQDFQELLMIEAQRPRRSHSARTNHSSEGFTDGPFCNVIPSELFDVGEFLHELVAVAEPIKPLAKEGCDKDCENYRDALLQGWLTDPDAPKSGMEGPFAVLQRLKDGGPSTGG